MTSNSGRQGQDPVPDESPAPAVTCCLCQKPVPATEEVFALDAEWKRRFPAMVGVLACEECVLETEFRCQDETGNYVAGHIPASDLPPQEQDVDSWSHLPGQGSQVAMVQQYASSVPTQRAAEAPAPVIVRETSIVDLTQQRTDLMGLIDAWQTVRPLRSRTSR